MRRNAALIACAMLEDEIRHAAYKTDTDIETVWIDKGLHEYPDKLRNELQKRIDENQDKDVILLAFCLCGNAVLGLKSERAALIIPRFDDCIHMLMAHECGQKPEIETGVLYYTRGWLESERSMLRDYESYIEKYGRKKADFIIKTMLSGYRALRLVDTGAYDAAGCLEMAKDVAEKLGLAFQAGKGTNRIIEGLMKGEYSREYVVLMPGETVESRHFGY